MDEPSSSCKTKCQIRGYAPTLDTAHAFRHMYPVYVCDHVCTHTTYMYDIVITCDWYAITRVLSDRWIQGISSHWAKQLVQMCALVRH